MRGPVEPSPRLEDMAQRDRIASAPAQSGGGDTRGPKPSWKLDSLHIIRIPPARVHGSAWNGTGDTLHPARSLAYLGPCWPYINMGHFASPLLRAESLNLEVTAVSVGPFSSCHFFRR